MCIHIHPPPLCSYPLKPLFRGPQQEISVNGGKFQSGVYSCKLCIICKHKDKLHSLTCSGAPIVWKLCHPKFLACTLGQLRASSVLTEACRYNKADRFCGASQWVALKTSYKISELDPETDRKRHQRRCEVMLSLPSQKTCSCILNKLQTDQTNQQ